MRDGMRAKRDATARIFSHLRPAHRREGRRGHIGYRDFQRRGNELEHGFSLVVANALQQFTKIAGAGESFGVFPPRIAPLA